MRRAVVVLGVLWALAPAPRVSLAQESAASLDAWLRAVRTHVPGRNDDAAAAIARWPSSAANDVLSDLMRRRDLAIPERDLILERGALLHADIAIAAHRPDGSYALPSDGRNILVIKDGERSTVVGGTFQWAFARRLLDAVTRGSNEAFARAWYRATAARLQSWEDHAELQPHLDHALERFPSDPVLLLIQGTLHMRFAALGIESGGASIEPPLVAPARGAGSAGATLSAPDQPGANELRAAAASFREALKSDPALDEARVRLGDVLGAFGRHIEALDQLQAALARPLPAGLEYDASLLAGREDEALGRTADAQAAYRRAVDLFPTDRTARLALSRSLREAGDRAGAAGVLDALANPTVSPDDDPWWSYDNAHVPSAEELLADLPGLLVAR